jgi:hypothetical protein
MIAASGAFFRGIDPNLEDMHNPIFARSTIGRCDESTVLGGYSLVNADSLEEALALAKHSPTLERDGGVEVGELSLLNPDSVATTFADHPAAASTAA